jgi:hypothetical protein
MSCVGEEDARGFQISGSLDGAGIVGRVGVGDKGSALR